MTGAVILASRASGAQGEPAHNYCYSPSISDDGTRVAFTCEARWTRPTRTRRASDVYVRDLTTATTVLVSRAGEPRRRRERAVVARRRSARRANTWPSSPRPRTSIPPPPSAPTRVYRRQIGPGNPTVLVSRRTGAAGSAVGGTRAVDQRRRQPDRVHERTVRGGGPGRQQHLRRRLRPRPGRRHDRAREPRRRRGRRGQRDLPLAAIAGNGSSVAFESGATQFDNEHDSDTAPERLPALADGERPRRSWSASPPPGRRATSRRAPRSTTAAASSASSPRRPRSTRRTRIRRVTPT